MTYWIERIKKNAIFICYNFTGSTQTYLQGIIQGPITDSYYISYHIQNKKVLFVTLGGLRISQIWKMGDIKQSIIKVICITLWL